MTTACSHHTSVNRVRNTAIAVAFALTSLLPASSSTVFADGEQVRPTPTATVVAVAPFSVDTSNGLTDLTAVADSQSGTATLLDAAKPDAKVLGKYENGTVFALRIDEVDSVKAGNGTQYWPVAVGGTNGWVSGLELSAEGQLQFAAPAPARAPYEFTGNMTAEVAADGRGLVLRAEPNDKSAKVASLPEGSLVTLRIDQVDTVYDVNGIRWWPVEFEGNVGWVNGAFLIEPGTDASVAATPSASTSNPSEPQGTPAAQGAFAVGDWAVVTTENEAPVDLLASPSSDATSNGSAPYQALVRVTEVRSDGWIKVRWDKTEGYMPEGLLRTSSAPRTTTGTSSRQSTAQPTTMTRGSTATVDSESSSGINVRQDAVQSSARVGQLADGADVTILDGPKLESGTGISWYQVESGGVIGWVDGALLNPKTNLNSQTPVPTAASSTSSSQAAGTAPTVPATAATSAASSGSTFIIPLTTYSFTQDFGCSNLGYYPYDPAWGCPVHDGVDLATAAGTTIMAAGSGTVVAAGWCDCGLGYYVEIDHGNGLHTVYGHMQTQPYVVVGQSVTQGDAIGPVGSTGLSTGPHVHFMVRKDGVAQDPKAYLPPLK